MNNSVYKQRISEVESASGSGTSMISLYISSGSNLTSERTRISQEKSEAQNIKSDSNRKNVQSALDRVDDILKRYQKTPENGLIIFAGVSQNEGTIDYVFDSLPEELQYSDYTCDSSFDTDPIRELIAPKHTIGLLVIERGGCVIGELRGTQITVHYDEKSYVRSQHNAGGFSNRRFDRLIEESTDNYFKSVSEKLEEKFINNNTPTIDGFVIGGTAITVDNFTKNHLPKPLQDIQIGGGYSVDIANAESLTELVEKAQNEIETVTEQTERKTVNQFFNAVRSNSDSNATYGKQNIDTAIQYGAVDTLLISADKSPELIQKYTDKTENQGGDVVLISTEFSKGQQFTDGFGGLGAILRYSID